LSFASSLFLWYFLPAALIARWVLPHRCRNGVLAVFSIAFYTVGGKQFVFLLLAMMVLNYAAGLAVSRARTRGGRPSARTILVAAVTADLLVLAVWKYLGFGSEVAHTIAARLGLGDTGVVDLVLPIGISFFTFHHLSYVVDIYRGTRPPMRNPLTFATYIAMFPQLIAGPIVRYHEIDEQLRDQRGDKLQNFIDGFPRFVWGLTKKVVIADSLAPLADIAFASNDPSFATAWIGAIAYTGQIYFDFSGYSDMAIGLAMMFGLRLPENFRRPYSAASITDFWRRWHMSLSRWFRDYLYVPLGGNRHGTTKTYRNLVIVFFATGLWHGAAWTFVIWGAYHGAWLIIERATGLAKVEGFVVVRRLATFLVVVVGWVLFRASDLSSAGTMLRAMLVPHELREPFMGVSPDLALILDPRSMVLLALVVATVLLPGSFVVGRIIDGLDGISPRRQLSARLVALTISPYVAVAVVAGSFSPFLYFQF
jgi:alginate O-acetyltransferase complex protein AlgI